MAANPAEVEVEVVSPDMDSVSEEEVLRYATFLGIDAEKDEDLLWIAHAGLRQPAPEPWLTCKRPGDSIVFFHNPDTGTSTWSHPQDRVFKEFVRECLASRVAVPVTLTVRAAVSDSSSSVEVVAHKLSGHETVTMVSSPWRVSFACVRCDLEKKLCQFLPANAVVRFFLADGTQLGRSYSARTVAEVFCLPSDTPIAKCPHIPAETPRAGACRFPKSRFFPPAACSGPPQSDDGFVHGACFSF
jgi:hypothetical protein